MYWYCLCVIFMHACMHFTHAQGTVMYVCRLETDIEHPWLFSTLLTEAGSLSAPGTHHSL